jgi:hypothetical protein
MVGGRLVEQMVVAGSSHDHTTREWDRDNLGGTPGLTDRPYQRLTQPVRSNKLKVRILQYDRVMLKGNSGWLKQSMSVSAR